MIYHVLNGDALVEKFPKQLEGEIIVIREAFMDGPVSESFDEAYWSERMLFVAEAFEADAATYWLQFGSQLVKMREIKDADEVVLWFEDDLFCLANMMMAVNYIQLHSHPIFYRVFPVADVVRWRGFGNEDEASLSKRYEDKMQLTKTDVELIRQLWKAFAHNDINRMRKLAQQPQTALRFLPAVIDAHLERLHPDINERQPEKLLHEIMGHGRQNFESIFEEFSKRAGVYGYGDVQIRKIVRGVRA